MNFDLSQRNTALQFVGPVAVFWLALTAQPSPHHGHHCIAVAYCIACYRIDRSMVRVEKDSYAVLPDEREALLRLKERQDCPHTETAEISMELLTLENPAL